MKRRALHLKLSWNARAAVCALLALSLCLSDVAFAAGKKKAPAQKQVAAAPKPTAAPLPDASKISEVPRDRVSQEGIWYLENAGRSVPVRLPASIDFREGNLFSADGRWVRVTYLSRNSREPAFKLGRREKYFHDNVLYPQEEAILDYAQLYLFPKSAGQNSKIAVEAWMGDLDSFLALHRNDPVVVRHVQSFVFKFANQPPRGYLPGDQLWDTRRRFATWNQFYEYPFQYDLSGNALVVDGKPLDNIPVAVSKDKLSGLPRLYPYVMRNLEYTFEALRTVMLEGSAAKADDDLAEISAVRRSYLTLKLLKAGHELWERMNANPK